MTKENFKKIIADEVIAVGLMESDIVPVTSYLMTFTEYEELEDDHPITLIDKEILDSYENAMSWYCKVNDLPVQGKLTK